MKSGAAVQNKIHLRSSPGPPEGYLEVRISVLDPGTQVLEYKAFEGYGGHAEHLSMREGGDFKEPVEIIQSPDQSFRLHLLLQIEIEVSPEGFLRRIRHDHEGYHAQPQVIFQIELRSQLRGHKGVHGANDRSARQQVDA